MIRIALALLALFAAAAQAQSLDGRLKRIADAKTVNIAYRADAMPFSYTDDKKEVAGFTVDLCKRVVNSIARQLNVPELKINWVLVTVQTRFDAVAKGEADMECGSSTVTLARMKQVDFSSFTFVESTGLLVKAASAVRAFPDIAGKRIAVIGGTTNERAVTAQLKRRQIDATVLAVKSSDEGLAALESGKVDAYASDKLLLVGAIQKAKDPKSFALLPESLSFEPYGIALPRGDAGMRLAVNTGLAQVYGSGEIAELFDSWFAPFGPPSDIMQMVYIMGAIPE
ncbi:MAG TPA: amino acid ABC transporter substrate-binding protein [Burkholderiales bacterium]|nr:amino acid ABC transporter substrate-binding protein [Burkholderiales bacterium]